MIVKTIPDSLRDKFLGRGVESRFDAWLRDSTTRVIPLGRTSAERDTVVSVPIPAGHRGQFLAVRLVADGVRGSVNIVDINELVVHARIDGNRGWVFVTRARDGKPVGDARITVHGSEGDVLVRARTDSTGIAALARPTRPFFEASQGWRPSAFVSYLDVASVDGDAFLTLGGNANGFESSYGASTGGIQPLGSSRPVATILGGGSYGFGDIVPIASTIRDGIVGAAEPLSGDSARLIVTRVPPAAETVYVRAHRLTPFGTMLDSVVPPTRGNYVATVELRRGTEWRWAGSMQFGVGDIGKQQRVTIEMDTTAVRFAGDSVRVDVHVRDSSGAPLPHAIVRWGASTREVAPWEMRVAGAENAMIGEWSWLDPLRGERTTGAVTPLDTLDAAGRGTLTFVPWVGPMTRPARVTMNATVRYTTTRAATASTSFRLETAQLYVAARDARRASTWRAGVRDSVEVFAITPTGKRVSGIRIDVHVVRSQPVLGDRVVRWTADTVKRISLVSGAAASWVDFNPPTPGFYEIRFSARDERKWPSTTSISGYATDTRLNDAALRLNLTPTRAAVSVGDTAVVTYTNPFASAEAWIVIEREGVIEQRRAAVRAGRQEIRLATTQRHAPVVYVSVLLVAPPAANNPRAVRAGSVQLRVAR
jgi:uncharacterized protein YfaS (alpha-2-macroglobulin family)